MALKPDEYVEKFLGAKVNRKIMALAKAVGMVKEAIFDTREISQLTRLGQVGGWTGKNLDNAVQELKNALIKIADLNERSKEFWGISARIVADDNRKTYTYYTKTEFEDYRKNRQGRG